MKIAFSIILIIHGLIHLMGFLKAFNLVTIENLPSTISKSSGIVWLVVCVLFIFTLIAYLANINWWWSISILAILISQILIFVYWKDAKFGSIANLVILVPTVITCGSYFFTNMVANERNLMVTEIPQELPSNNNEIPELPQPIQRWLSKSGVTSTSIPKQVYISQSLQMKLDEGQENWVAASASQLFTPTQPAFNWQVELKLNKFIPIVGRDKFHKGKGGMLIKLFALYPVVNVADNKKINEASLQRYLAEISWFPHAALSQFISWESIDNRSAKATIHYNGTTATGIFEFDEKGNFLSFRTMRYKGVEKDDEKVEWIVNAIEYSSFNGVKIPSKLEAEWNFPLGKWKWLKIEVDSIQYTF